MRPKLYCVPFAGGSSYSYRGWQQWVGDAVEVVAVEYPGRGRSAEEPLALTMDALVEAVGAQVQASDGAWAIFGHSMGACVAYLTVHRAVEAGLPPPVHLFCSGRNGPAVPGDASGRHRLPRQAFVDVLRDFGGCPEPILRDPEMLDHFLPILRADFAAHATYAYRPAPPLDVPITAFRGLEDRETTAAGVAAWQQETRHPLEVVEVAGGHFFILEHADRIGRCLRGRLAAVRTAGSGPG